MNALTRKEIRLLMPAWAVAMFLAIVPCWFPTYNFACSTAGTLLVSLALFGQEFSSGTFQQLLSQPLSRTKLWRVKIGVLLGAILSVFITVSIAFNIGEKGHFFTSENKLIVLVSATSVCLMAAAFAGGLWTTLLFRQIAPSFWLSILVPSGLSLTTMALVEKIIFDNQKSRAPVAWALVVLILYAVAGYYLARRLFLQAQDAQWTGGTVSLPKWANITVFVPNLFKSKSRRWTAGSGARACTPYRALIWKELQAQQGIIFLAGLLLVLHLFDIGLRKVSFDPSHKSAILWQALNVFWMFWFGLPFIIGTVAVAEERKYGTLEGQHCLPATRGVQFGIKLKVVLLLGILLGGVLPWLLELFVVAVGAPRGFPDIGTANSLKIFVVVSFCVAFISFYASTFTCNILQAIGAAVIIGSILVTFYGFVENGGNIGHNNLYLWYGNLGVLISLPTLLLVMLFLGFKNYKSLIVGSSIWFKNALAISAAIGFSVILTTLLYNRAWELVVSFEPKHGLPQLSGPVRAEVFSVGGGAGQIGGKFTLESKVFALLPDGRLWAGSDYRVNYSGSKVDAGSYPRQSQDREKVYVAVPIGGIFVGSSNWTQLAGDWTTLAGLQADGSLWKIFSANARNTAMENLSALPVPERIGTDNDWKAVVAGWGHFLALKKDGTVWGWGRNDSGQLGPGSPQFTSNLVRIGRDSDWLKIFASQNSSVAVERDGSVWRWGVVFTGDERTPLRVKREIVRWTKGGTDWRDYVSLGSFGLILKDDGSVWATGSLTHELLGYHLPGWGFEVAFPGYLPFVSVFHDEPIQVGFSFDWSAIGYNSGTITCLKRSGALVRFNADHGRQLIWSQGRKPSKYSDWVAINKMSPSSQSLALAADGTLCSWVVGEEFNRADQSLLCPSRKPAWTANIFKNKSQ